MFPFVQTNDSLEQRRQLQKQRLRHRVQIQSQQIENVMAAHHLPAHVSGGKVQPQSIQFDLQTHLSGGWDRVRELTTDLRRALGVPDISVTRENGRFQVAVARPQDVPVTLLDVMAMKRDFPKETAVLGLSDQGKPVVLSLSRSDYSHALISGMTGAGKTALVRTICVSLALLNRQSRLQQIVLTALKEGEAVDLDLERLTYLPHLAANIIYDPEEVAQVLVWLVAELENRLANAETTPMLIVIIDNVTTFMARGGAAIIEPLTLLLQRGAKAGIHLILTTSEPDSPYLNSQLKANLPLRITGRVTDAVQAAAAMGMDGSDAEFLLGHGDFLLRDKKQMTYFQAAFVTDYDLHLCLSKLRRTGGYSILAQPFSVRPELPDMAGADEPGSFSWQDGAFNFTGEEGFQ
jgi:DNA segregation ATPase FtsK/SpoIIIE, S-DNA-T family